MKINYSLKQGTDEWHEVKHGKIGGSRSAGLFIKTDNLLLEILSEATEEFELDFGSYISDEMQRGNELEPIAREKLSEYTGVKFVEAGWIQCEENDLLGISPDGISECETKSCEIKCPGAKTHIKTIISNEIPLEHIPQCLHYFTINPKLEKHYFCSFRPESNIKQLFVKELTRDSIVNLGTNSKPVMRSIAEAVTIAKMEANILKAKVDEKLKELSF